MMNKKNLRDYKNSKDEALQEFFVKCIKYLNEDFKLMLEKAYWTGYGEGCKDTKEDLKGKEVS